MSFTATKGSPVRVSGAPSSAPSIRWEKRGSEAQNDLPPNQTSGGWDHNQNPAHQLQTWCPYNSRVPTSPVNWGPGGSPGSWVLGEQGERLAFQRHLSLTNESTSKQGARGVLKTPGHPSVSITDCGPPTLRVPGVVLCSAQGPRGLIPTQVLT